MRHLILFLLFLSTSVFAQNKVGIGTSTPINQLHIHDSSAIVVDNGISITNNYTGATISDGMRIRQNATVSSIANNEDGDFVLTSFSNLYRFIMKPNYLNGLNINNPSADLHIGKSASAPTKIKLTNFAIGQAANDGLDFSINEFGNASIMNNESGLLGIGTTNPAANLHVHAGQSPAGLRISSDFGTSGILLWRKNDSSENYIEFGNNNSFIDWKISEKPISNNLAITNMMYNNELLTCNIAANSIGINNPTPDNNYSLDVRNPFGNNGIKSQGSAYGIAGAADSNGKIVGLFALPSAGVYGTANGNFLTNGVYGLMNTSGCTDCNAVLAQALNGNSAIKAEATGIGSIALNVAGPVKASGPSGNRFARTLAQTTNSYIMDIPTSLSNDPNDIILVTHQYVGQYINSPIGVWWDGTKWTLFREDGQAISVGEKFNVICIKN